jgi:hypothetical protein
MSEAYDDLPALEFWNVQRTSEELEIPPSSLKKVRPYLHVLRLPRNSYLYPGFYTTLFKSFIEGSGTDLQEPARILAQTIEARRTIELEEDILSSRLRDEDLDGLIYAQDLRKVIGISPGTITDWQKREDMPMVRENKRVRIPSLAISTAISWQRPEGMPPAGSVFEPPTPTTIS